MFIFFLLLKNTSIIIISYRLLSLLSPKVFRDEVLITAHNATIFCTPFKGDEFIAIYRPLTIYRPRAKPLAEASIEII